MPPPPASQAGTAMRPQLTSQPPRRAPMGSAAMPALPPTASTREPSINGGPTLFLMFNNQRFTIDKDQFIIGRGSKSSDLPIKDGNISRKHAAVIRRNGMFYIKDLGSTNGIDYKGMRIDNKRIDEGDVFHLCDYELRFTYR
jgi:pSer/pThr/pTyr-binding forkhead associated (FHA) protein